MKKTLNSTLKQTTDHKHKPQYILFDLGFVLVKLNGMPWFKRTFPNLSDQEIHRKWLELPSVQHFETGVISESEFFASAVEELNTPETPEEFAKIFKHWVQGPYLGSAELVTNLKRHYRVGCLSNTNSCHISHLNKLGGLLNLFDDRFYSYELGLMKPDPKAYQHVLNILDIKPEQILFIDDNRDNVDTASSLGIQAFYAKGFEQVIQVLRSQLGEEDLSYKE